MIKIDFPMLLYEIVLSFSFQYSVYLSPFEAMQFFHVEGLLLPPPNPEEQVDILILLVLEFYSILANNPSLLDFTFTPSNLVEFFFITE